MKAQRAAPHAQVRDLAPGDLEAVGELVTNSFGTDLRPYLVPAQPQWKHFLALVLAQRPSFPTHLPAVVERAGQVVAFADYRALGDGDGFLSYICVAPEARGQGLARYLIRELVRRNRCQRLALDVFETNAAALSLYASMGFREDHRQAWWRAGLPPGGVPLALTNLPAALGSLRTYGFCEVKGEREGQPFRYGRTGQRVLRAYSAADLDDEDTVAALSATFPEMTERFAVLEIDESPTSRGVDLILTSLRLVADPVSMAGGAP